MPATTITSKLSERAAETPNGVALRYKAGGRWQDITWADYGSTVTRAGAAFRALGVQPGDRVAVLSGNRPEWHFADMACMSIGGVTVPVYASNSPEQVAHIVGHSGATVAVVEDGDQLAKVTKMRSDLKRLEKVVVIDPSGIDSAEGLAISWPDFLASSSSSEPLASGTGPGGDDLATFVYTSGTTGSPKGVMLTHGNLWWTCVSTETLFEGRMQGARTISYLPLSHIAERMLSHLLQIYYGSQTWFAESRDTLIEDMKACRPTYFFAVPRVWEKLYSGIQGRLAETDPKAPKTRLARRAIAVGEKVAQAEQRAVERGGALADAKVPLGVRAQHVVLDKAVLRKVRAALGLDECRLPLSAAAPLNPALVWFFHSIGLKIAEGYGQSEDTGPTAWNPPSAPKVGTVGLPFPGCEVRVVDDGEILVKGGNVTSGYYNDDDATAELIDGEGWMHSGDIGVIDDNGYIRITDRKKDLIITAGGKNIAPQEIEGRIQIHPLVSQVVVVGDRLPYVTALVTLDEEAALKWGKEQGIHGDLASVASHERMLQEIKSAIEDVNKGLARAETVKKFRVLERDFDQDSNEVTPTLKIRRRHINQAYQDVINDMYRDGSPEAASAQAQ